MTKPALYVTDGATEVELLRGPFRLSDWNPARAPLKGGGVWRSSPFVDGRQLVAFRRDNIIDTYTLMVTGGAQDELIYTCQEADRLLTKAMQYWTTSWQDAPVYLVARGTGETNARYAHIHAYSFPNADNPYAPPFSHRRGLRLAMEDLTLVIEHGPWLELPPALGGCTPISAEDDYDSAAEMEVHVVASADDCYVDEGGAGTMDLAGVTLRFGHLAGNDENAGMRFQVNIPRGVTITYAYVSFQADFADAVAVVNVAVSCEDVDNAAVFVAGAPGYANFMGRARTAAAMAWSPGAWIAGQFYTTPDFAPSVQEVIDRPGWVGGYRMVVFVDENGSTAAGAERRASSWDHGADLEPVLHVGYAPARTYGRDSSDVCARIESLYGYILKEDGDRIVLEDGSGFLLMEGMPYEVYVANKTNMANLTHIWQWDPGPLWANLIDAVPPPTGLFRGAIGAGVANGAYIDFCIDSTVDDSGPFCSLVFDIGTAAAIGAATTLDWVYPTAAAAWAALPVRDNTNSFQTTHVNSVHWIPPTNWFETFNANGTVGYCVRCIVNGVNMTNPSQQNRRIYTITWPRYDLAAADVGGDIVALVRSTADNQASDGASPDLPFNEMWLGLRSLDRGNNFAMHLNVADEQNPPGITCTAANTAGPLAFVVNDTTPTGWDATDTITAANTLTVTWSMDNTIMPEYWGTYHAFVRGKQHTGNPGDVLVQLITQARPTAGGVVTALWSSTPVAFELPTVDWEMVDLGKVSLPPIGIAHPTFDIFEVLVQVTDAVTGTTDVTLYDLVLLPIDEWAGAFSNLKANAEVDQGLFLDVDSVSDPKRLITCVNRIAATGNIFTMYQVIANDHALVQANATQRMYHLFAAGDFGVPGAVSNPCISCAVWLFTNQQYLNMRGDR